MKQNVFLAFTMAASLALAQAPAPSKEAAKPAMTKEPEKAMPVKQTAKKPSPKRFEDARHCLEQPNNDAIIKCAEAYL